MIMHGFQHVLAKWCQITRPAYVHEWGPGLSTRVILDECAAKITSVEHQLKYLEKAQADFSGDTERLTLLHHDAHKSDSQYATCIFDRPRVGLAFVDGRRRVECVIAAMHNLTPGGVILLHDISRANYQKMLLPLVEVLEFRDNTLVMRPHPSLVRPLFQL